MEIHRFEKIWTAVAILLIVGFISTIVYGAVGPGVDMLDRSGGTVEDELIANQAWDQEPNFEEPTQVAQHVEGDRYEAYLVARRFSFNPGTGSPLTVPAGSTVTLYVTSPDVMHGFQVVGTNVNTMVIPGQVSKMTVRFEEPATYSIVCNEYCGSAHHLMEGTLEVVPQSEFEEMEG
jgi:cytochrome c oxidase subunit 2